MHPLLIALVRIFIGLCGVVLGAIAGLAVSFAICWEYAQNVPPQDGGAIGMIWGLALGPFSAVVGAVVGGIAGLIFSLKWGE